MCPLHKMMGPEMGPLMKSCTYVWWERLLHKTELRWTHTWMGGSRASRGFLWASLHSNKSLRQDRTKLTLNTLKTSDEALLWCLELRCSMNKTNPLLP